MEAEPPVGHIDDMGHGVTISSELLSPFDSLGIPPDRPPVVWSDLDDLAKQAGMDQGRSPDPSAEERATYRSPGGVGEDLAEGSGCAGRTMCAQQIHHERR